MSTVERVLRAPLAALEFTNILLTQNDAEVGVTPKDVVWTHRKTTLYRYRSDKRKHPIPVLLVFALINRPDIFDLRPGNSFVEFLLEQGFDVFLIDWGYPEEEDADMGLANYVCDELHWGIRETLRASGQDELSLLGWCIGGTLSLMYGGFYPENPVRNMALLTTPVDTRGSLYASWVGRDSFDVDYVAEGYKAIPGPAVDWANKMMKPVTNYWTTYRRLWEGVLARARRARRPISRWRGGWPTTRRSRPPPTASGSPRCTRRTAWCAAACGCGASWSTWRRSIRACSWSPPARITSRRHRGRVRCSISWAQTTSPALTAPAATSA